MLKFVCNTCKVNKALIKRPKNQQPICQDCFFVCFQTQIHETITKFDLFKPGDKIAIGASGGKDSTVLVHVLNKLNKQYNYGVQLFMLAIDEGIKGYRDDSLEAVKRNQQMQGLPLEILAYKDLYGWSMDLIVQAIGQTNNCTYCGVLRRQSLQRGAIKLGCNKVATGHNADDIAETVLMNMLRGDLNRLGICVNAISGEQDDPLSLPRVKPLKYAYEKQIVLYAYHKKLDYFSTECIYSPFAYRGHVRDLIKQMQLTRPQSIIDIIYSAQCIKITENKKPVTKQKCGKMWIYDKQQDMQGLYITLGAKQAETEESNGTDLMIIKSLLLCKQNIYLLIIFNRDFLIQQKDKQLKYHGMLSIFFSSYIFLQSSLTK